MSLFVNHKIEQLNNEYIVTLYLDKRYGSEEFSDEFLNKNKKLSLESEVKNYLRNHVPNFKTGIVKIALGTIILTILPLHALAEEKQPELTQEENYIVEIEQTEDFETQTAMENISTPEQTEIDPIISEPNSLTPSEETQDEVKIVNKIETINVKEETPIVEELTYTVQAGDTLTRISKQFNIPIDYLKSINGLTSDMIYVGQELKILETDSITTSQAKAKDTAIILKQGDSKSEVKEMKIKLAEIGFTISNNPNNDFGPKTEETVREFQAYYGLNPTGIVDQTTLDKIDSILSTPLRFWNQHEDVLLLKKDLAILGFGVSKNPNNVFGPKTVDTVKEFQKANGLLANGIADDVTLAKISELLKMVSDSENNQIAVDQSPTYKIGDSNPKIKEMKQKLARLGFIVSSNPNNDFGPKTEDTVKEFQKAHGLKVNGIADQSTFTKIESLLNTVSDSEINKSDGLTTSIFKIGDSNPKIREMKLKLAELGFIVSNNPNNDFGPKTEDTIKEFQKANDLKPNGIADELTLNKIDNLLNQLNGSTAFSLKIGDSSPKVKEIKLNLAELGFVVSKNPNNDFGPKTEETIKEFQSYYGLNPTGILDQATIEKIDSILASPLRYWNQHENVLALKEDLAILGFGVSNNPNNVFGPKTEDTVKMFQKANGLKVNGIADEVTLKKIDELLKTLPNAFGRILKLNDTGEDVRLLQTYLNDVGFKVVEQPTSYYGTLTENQVKLFQISHGLTPSGIADAKTLNKLITARNGDFVNINEFLVSGKGYGHAVGMTQWGAYGMAQAGYSYDEILSYYYTGTEIGNRNTDNQNVRVLLAENTSILKISSNQPYQVGDKVFESGTETTIQFQNGEYLIINNNKTYKRQDKFQIVSTNDGLLHFDGKQYEGAFYISTKNNKLDLINHLNVENYLKGVVPFEIIPSWDNNNLFKAQTLAARTYVIKELQRNQYNNFDVYDTVRSQVYNGIPKDVPERYVTKINQAISDTKGEVIIFKGELIDAVYSASAGGHTVDASDVWGNSVPYLIGKEDPYDASKYSTNWWNYTISKQEIETLYPDVGKILNVSIVAKKFGRPTQIDIIGEKKTISVSGSAFRQKIGLDKMQSNTFTIEGVR